MYSKLCSVKGMEDEICPYATFHLLGFREEMDPTKAMNFQTFPHQNGGGVHPGAGHAGTIGPVGPNHPGHIHSRSGSQSMVNYNFFVIYCIFRAKFFIIRPMMDNFAATSESICTKEQPGWPKFDLHTGAGI